MPINLDISEADVRRLGAKPGARIALVDGRDDAALAIITGEWCALSHVIASLNDDISGGCVQA